MANWTVFKIPKDWLTDDIFILNLFDKGKKKSKKKKQKCKVPEVWMRSYCRNRAIYDTSLTHGQNTSWFKQSIQAVQHRRATFKTNSCGHKKVPIWSLSDLKSIWMVLILSKSQTVNYYKVTGKLSSAKLSEDSFSENLSYCSCVLSNAKYSVVNHTIRGKVNWGGQKIHWNKATKISYLQKLTLSINSQSPDCRAWTSIPSTHSKVPWLGQSAAWACCSLKRRNSSTTWANSERKYILHWDLHQWTSFQFHSRKRVAILLINIYASYFQGKITAEAPALQ